MSKQKILLVDDEQDILDLLSYNLEKEGYDVYTAHNGIKCLEIARQIIPDIILLDVMMPEMDGMEACKEIRDDDRLKNVLVAFLTARNEDYSQIAGFDSGADDYISKPIKTRVLISRVKALLRRNGALKTEDTKIDQVGISIDKDKYLVFKEGQELTLPKKEFELYCQNSLTCANEYYKKSIDLESYFRIFQSPIN